MQKQRFTYKSTIVGFDFLECEVLIIIMDNGEYSLIDPFKGQKKKHLIPKEVINLKKKSKPMNF